MIELTPNMEAAFTVCDPPMASNGYSGSLAVHADDVAEVIALDERRGDWAEMDVVYVFKTADGRFCVMRAWCDTTGWDCQAGGKIEVAGSLKDLVRWSLTDEERTRLNLALGDT